MTGQVKIDGDMTSMAAFKTFRDVIQRNAAKGGFSPKEVGEAILGSERQFAGLGFDKRMTFLECSFCLHGHASFAFLRKQISRSPQRRWSA